MIASDSDTLKPSHQISSQEDQDYSKFLSSVNYHFQSISQKQSLFTTDATNLFDIFLQNLPVDRQSHYNCNSCKKFINHFGSLVVIDSAGKTHSVCFDTESTPEFFRPAVFAMIKVVEKAKVTGVFYSEDKSWGMSKNRSQTPPYSWTHFAITPSKEQVFSHPLLTAFQKTAERHEEYGMLCRSFGEFPMHVVEQAQQLLTSGNLFRSEKCIGVANWLVDLHRSREKAKKNQAENLTWLAVASAPAGFCHVKSGMIGTLLEDIKAEMTFEQIKARFDSKMNPKNYQRPQAPPKAGNLAQAEAIVENLSSSGSLRRRFARLEDLKLLWQPTPSTPAVKKDGVFSHLQPKQNTPPAQIYQPAVTMTWEKFNRTVIPDAKKLEMKLEGWGNYVALVTAADMDAPPILQWDSPEQRNPVSLYVYSGGSAPSSWGLSGSYAEVTGITLKPSQWYGDYPHQGKGVILVLNGAKDSRNNSLALFPEILKSEYHGIRSSIEAYSGSRKVEGQEEASACGMVLSEGKTAWQCEVRVTDGHGKVTSYKLDRWD